MTEEREPKVRIQCRKCKSDDLTVRRTMAWDEADQDYKTVPGASPDHWHCRSCFSGGDIGAVDFIELGRFHVHYRMVVSVDASDADEAWEIATEILRNGDGEINGHSIVRDDQEIERHSDIQTEGANEN